MKLKIIFSFLLSFILMGTAQARAPENLIEAIGNSITAEGMMEQAVDLTYGKTVLKINSVIRQEETKMEQDADFGLQMNLRDLDEYAPEGGINVDFGLNYSKDFEKQQHFLEINNLKIKVELGEEEELMAEFINGVLEYAKLVTGKTFELNILQIKTRFLEMISGVDSNFLSDEEAVEMMEFYLDSFLNEMNLRNNLGGFLAVILDSGVFQVIQKETGVYLITWAESPRLYDAREFLSALLEYMVFPSGLADQLKAELAMMTAEDVLNIREESAADMRIWKQVMKLEVEITTRNNKVEKVNTSFVFDPRENDEFYMFELSDPLVIDSILKFSYQPVSITMPEVTDDMVSLTKFFQGVMALIIYENQQYAEMEAKWDEERDLWAEENYESVASPDLRLVEIGRVRDEMRMSSQHEWYEEYIYHVSQTLNLDFPLNPNELVTNEQLFEVLKKMVEYIADGYAFLRYDDQYSIHLSECNEGNVVNYDFYYNVMVAYSAYKDLHLDECVRLKKDQLVTRKFGLENISRSGLNKVLDPMSFIQGEAVVSTSYLSADNQFKIMNHAEMAKIVSKVLDMNTQGY
jgi:hypothetical protein